MSDCCVYNLGRRIFEECDPDVKAILCIKLRDLFHGGSIPVLCRDVRHVKECTPLSRNPFRPSEGSPNYIAPVPPGRVPGSRRARTTIIHALVHAESYAMDTSTDIMVRFGFLPRLWDVESSTFLHQDGAFQEVSPLEGAILSRCDGDTEAAAGAGGSSAPATASSSAASSMPSSHGSSIKSIDHCDCPLSCPAYHLPRAFFLDWTRVAAEEAKHYGKWKGRLEALGGKYGDCPGHDSMWQAAADTGHSLAARLAIVHMIHEARGLDTSISTRARFDRAGDKESVAVLDANVAEEVGHVSVARHWFVWLLRRWQGKGKTSLAEGWREDAATLSKHSQSAYRNAVVAVVVATAAADATESASTSSSSVCSSNSSSSSSGTSLGVEAKESELTTSKKTASTAVLLEEEDETDTTLIADAIEAYHKYVDVFHCTKTLKPPVSDELRRAAGLGLSWYKVFLPSEATATAAAGADDGE